MDVEFPHLVKLHKNKEITLIPVLARPCAWDSYEWLARLQFMPSDGQSLAELPAVKADLELTSLARFLRALLEDRDPDPEPTSPRVGLRLPARSRPSSGFGRVIDARRRFGDPQDELAALLLDAICRALVWWLELPSARIRMLVVDPNGAVLDLLAGFSTVVDEVHLNKNDLHISELEVFQRLAPDPGFSTLGRLTALDSVSKPAADLVCIGDLVCVGVDGGTPGLGLDLDLLAACTGPMVTFTDPAESSGAEIYTSVDGDPLIQFWTACGEDPPFSFDVTDQDGPYSCTVAWEPLGPAQGLDDGVLAPSARAGVYATVSCSADAQAAADASAG